MTTPEETTKQESSKAKEACDLYVSMGPDRSLAKVAAQMGRSPGYRRVLEAWSSQFGWVKRAHDYDEEQREKRRLRRQIELDKLYDNLAELCRDQLEKTLADLEKLRGSTSGLSNIATVQLLKLIIDTHLHVLGDSDKQKIELTGKDDGPLEVDVTTFWGRGTDPRRKAPEINEAPKQVEEDAGDGDDVDDEDWEDDTDEEE